MATLMKLLEEPLGGDVEETSLKDNISHSDTVNVYFAANEYSMAEITLMEEEPGFIVKFFDKAYEDKSILELTKAPVDAISGVSKSDAEDLKKAFGIKTVEDLAMNKYVRLAQGINLFSACSGQILDRKFESKEYENLAEKPVSAISGVSEGDAALLKKAFGIDTIRELAENKYVAIAQATVSLASLVQILRDAGIL